MRTFTKRELNQKTAEVLSVLDAGEEMIIITERGEQKYGYLRSAQQFEGSLVLIVARP